MKASQLATLPVQAVYSCLQLSVVALRLLFLAHRTPYSNGKLKYGCTATWYPAASRVVWLCPPNQTTRYTRNVSVDFLEGGNFSASRTFLFLLL